ncbi:hypothetical protein SNE40_006847 [Patella caerulea]|uniref:Apolipoprotein L3-like n=1 Tax=Patella caerulea TaxID=87958 RepID=A0AAN8PSZ9_PATCE
MAEDTSTPENNPLLKGEHNNHCEVSEESIKDVVPEDRSTDESTKDVVPEGTSTDDTCSLLTADDSLPTEEIYSPTGDEYEEFCKIREETIRLLYDTAEELDKLARDVRITNIAGSTGGIVSAGMIVGGVVGSFFTFGAALPLAIAGAGLGVASAATSVGASLADAFISKKRQTLINEALEKDNKSLEKLFNMTLQLKLQSAQLENPERIVHGAAVVGRATVVASDTSRVAVCIMRGASKAAAVGGLVVSIVTLPIDVAVLVQNSKAIHEDKPHQLAEHFRAIAEELTANLRDEILPCLFDKSEYFLENDPALY